MTQDTGIFEIRLSAFEGMQVGTANADAADLYDGFAGPCDGRLRFAVFEVSGLYADQRFHNRLCISKRAIEVYVATINVDELTCCMI